MTMIDETFTSLKATATNSIKTKPQKVASAGKPRKAGKVKIARQKKSQSNRKKLGSKRSFRLSLGTLKKLRAERGKAFINPYRESSIYHACIAALQKMGIGKWHTLESLAVAIQAEMGSDAAKTFKAKEKRNPKTGKNWKDRLVQNAKVLSRPDYGAKLRQVGYEVRINREKGAGLFKRA